MWASILSHCACAACQKHNGRKCILHWFQPISNVVLTPEHTFCPVVLVQLATSTMGENECRTRSNPLIMWFLHVGIHLSHCACEICHRHNGRKCILLWFQPISNVVLTPEHAFCPIVLVQLATSTMGENECRTRSNPLIMWF